MSLSYKSKIALILLSAISLLILVFSVISHSPKPVASGYWDRSQTLIASGYWD